jgi:hypothetical protein
VHLNHGADPSAYDAALDAWEAAYLAAREREPDEPNDIGCISRNPNQLDGVDPANFPAGRTMVAPGTHLVPQFVAKPN